MTGSDKMWRTFSQKRNQNNKPFKIWRQRNEGRKKRNIVKDPKRQPIEKIWRMLGIGRERVVAVVVAEAGEGEEPDEGGWAVAGCRQRRGQM